jgi:hypothetical protein
MLDMAILISKQDASLQVTNESFHYQRIFLQDMMLSLILGHQVFQAE